MLITPQSPIRQFKEAVANRLGLASLVLLPFRVLEGIVTFAQFLCLRATTGASPDEHLHREVDGWDESRGNAAHLELAVLLDRILTVFVISPTHAIRDGAPTQALSSAERIAMTVFQ